jgi:hypothetical protein
MPPPLPIFELTVNRLLLLESFPQRRVMPSPFLTRQLGFADVFLKLFELAHPNIDTLLSFRQEQFVALGFKSILNPSQVRYAGACGKKHLADVSPALDDRFSTLYQIGVIDAEHGCKNIFIYTSQKTLQAGIIEYGGIIGRPQGIHLGLAANEFKGGAVIPKKDAADPHFWVGMDKIVDRSGGNTVQQVANCP